MHRYDRGKGLLRDSRGGTALETSFALPVLVMLMVGLLQVALVMHANGALRHTLGQGIRFAKVYPGATQAEVIAQTRGSLADLDPDKITSLTFERGTATNGATYARLSIRYELRPVIPFGPVTVIPLSQTRSAYIQS